MTDVGALKNQRGRIKGSLTKSQTFVDSINARTLTEEIAARLEKLEELWQSFIEIDDELVRHEVPSEFDEFEDKYFRVKAQLRKALNLRLASENEPQPSTSSTDQFNSTMIRFIEQQKSVFDSIAQQSTSTQVDVKLPKVNIPSFSGDYKDWPSFKDLFTSSVHQKTSLSNSHKFQYLKSALTGDAASLIKHIIISDSNYIEAWNKLLSRYDKKKQILTSYIKTFLSQASVNQASASSLRKLTDTSDELIRGIKSLGNDASSRDPWLVHLLLNKCDPETRQSWAEETSEIDLPSFDQLLSFLNKRCDALETIDSTAKKPSSKLIRTLHANMSIQCPHCKQSHQLFQCPEFKIMNITAKRNFVKQKKLCFNCLSSGHLVHKCNSKHRCHSCNKPHHSSLHLHEDLQHNQVKSHHSASNVSAAHQPKSSQLEGSQLNADTPAFVQTKRNCTSSAEGSPQLTVFTSMSPSPIRLSVLPTALVLIKDISGTLQSCRVLIDSGSQASFIAEECVRRLGLKRRSGKFRVTGLGESSSGVTKGSVNLTLHSRIDNDHQITVTALILPKLTSTLPSTSFNVKDWHFLKDYELADPHFNIPNKIDILLGADCFFYILKDGNRVLSNEIPALQNTIFGYILSGNVAASSKTQSLTSLHADLGDIDRTLQKFWEIEELPPQNLPYSEEEQYCENLFQSTHLINKQTGRYIVKLPFKENCPPLGETLSIATTRFHSLERKLKSNSQLYDEYRKFMIEYQELGHLEVIPTSAVHSTLENAYLPHHAVLKPSSTTTKLRVVFDGSAISSSGTSLNQRLCVGPKVQRDLYPILLSFRTFKVAVTADIEKMYRQIQIAESDKTYQRIVWRNSPEEPVQHFWLTTVTYGTASAPFLATRALRQLGIEFKGKFPLAEEAIVNSFYVDDLMSGADDDTTAFKLYEELMTLLQKRGFTLRKWISNSTNFMRLIYETQAPLVQKFEPSDNVKVLGLCWMPSEDAFSFEVNLPEKITATKRKILSESSRIFDPLGLLSPVIVSVKIILQQLWLKNYNWDDTIDHDLAQKWEKITANLQCLQTLRIPRWLQTIKCNYELHGFSDASEVAYAAVVYCRTVLSNGSVSTTLMTAKSRVSPIKQISIPRLELCGALLLTKLMLTVKTALCNPDIDCVAWTDSKVVLAWLSSHPCKWKCYIGNRTSEILSTLPRKNWHHVFSADNPADLASRGVYASELVASELWWKGPSWLQGNWKDYLHEESSINQQSVIKEEMRPKFVGSFTVSIDNHVLDTLFKQISSITKIFRIVARCHRFYTLCKKSDNRNNLPWITAAEYNHARNICIQWTQLCAFSKEICLLRTKKSITTSPLQSLSPFLDRNGVLRVGGRLENSLCSYDTKHPIILPKDHIFTRLIIAHLHEKHFHSGATLLLNIIRQTYWIISARTAIKGHINKCISCIRHRAATSQQLMANLPLPRVSFTRAFENVGVDYAGPINLLLHRGRGAKSTKAYICLFTCLSTRASHLDVVSDMTSEAFLACLKRFTSRRGLPANLYSDNGTNFVGASRKLTAIYKTIVPLIHNSLIADFLSSSNITWHFNPPAAPHFGGSWESGVKLVKSHMRRTIGETKLTYEEMSTFLAQVEALLNSRPLTQMSSDVTDLDVLTPAHFLIGQPMVALPEPSSASFPSTLSRWRHLQKMHHDFWRRWYVEYLTTLQQRPKWTIIEDNPTIGELVVIKEDNLPPTAWLLGRIIAVHPGRDDLVRVVTLKTARGEFKRPITKICKLPIC